MKDDLEENVLTIDKRVLLSCIEANSNNFIKVDIEEDKVYVGKKRIYTTWDFLAIWIKNGRNNLKGEYIERIR